MSTTTGTVTYAWRITQDHLSPGDPDNDVGTEGPSDAPQALLDLLDKGKGHTFRMYDGDGELYVTGRLVAAVDGVPHRRPGDLQAERGVGIGGWTEHLDVAAAPLDDYGTGGLGCTEIRWPGHEEWDIG